MQVVLTELSFACPIVLAWVGVVAPTLLVSMGHISVGVAQAPAIDFEPRRFEMPERGDQTRKQVHRSTHGPTWTPDPRRFQGSPRSTDGSNIISSSWPVKVYFSENAGQSWQAANSLTAYGINRVMQGNAK